jgi:hypothetical protein
MDSKTEEDRLLEKLNGLSTLEPGEVVYLINKRAKGRISVIKKTDLR